MLKDLLESGNFWDLYIIARWSYKINNKILSDKKFDAVEAYLKSLEPDSHWFDISYEQDVKPTELLKKYELEYLVDTSLKIEDSVFEEYKGVLLENKGLSIKPLRDMESVFNWFRRFWGVEMVISLKVNGVNTNNIFDVDTNKVIVSGSKASAEDSTPIDYSKGSKAKLSEQVTLKAYRMEAHKKTSKYTNDTHIIVIKAEGYIDKKGIQKVKELCGKVYKNERSCAVGMFQTGLPVEIIPHAHFMCFSAMDNYSKLSYSLEELDDAGFETVPYLVETFEAQSIESFTERFKEIQKQLVDYAEENDIPYDGIVCHINDKEKFNSCMVNGLYSDGCIAVKEGLTGAEELETEVIDIFFEFGANAKEEYSLKILLNPVITRDNIEVKEISGYNLSIIQDLGIKVGDKVIVRIQSGCTPELYRKKV